MGSSGGSGSVSIPGPARKTRGAILLPALVLGFLALALAAASLLLGAVPVTPADFLSLLFPAKDLDPEVSRRLEGLSFITFQIRLPRILAALGAGSALALSGAAMQGLFRNPMAGPDILGISAGSSLGALISISSGIASAFVLALPLGALAGAILVGGFIFTISRGASSTSLFRIILAGMAVSSLVGGIISAILMFSPTQELKQFIFWTMGGLDGRTWDHLVLPALPLALAMAWLMGTGTRLDLLALGEEQAFSSGLDVEAFKLKTLLASSLCSAMAVVMAGPVGFVGLMMPHMVRLVRGPSHRGLLVLSGLAGACFLLAADLAGRIIAPPFEIKAGIITSLIGGPYFLFLVYRDWKRRGW